MLPDTLGPLNGPYCLALDDNPAHPRLYIGGVPGCESTGVIVADAITCKRLARIPTNTPKALCFVPSHGKLYVAKMGRDSVVVVDCSTNRIVSTIHTASIVPVMQYNSLNDRLYCGGDTISVIDCAADTVVHTIAVAASSFALDTTNDKLYAGGDGALAVIDCAADSVVASIPEIDSAGALCFNVTAQKVYAASGDTLYAIQTASDSIVARLPLAGLAPVLTCDPQRNRIYCTYSARWASIDCAGDTVILTTRIGVTADFVACNVARDRVYILKYVDAAQIFDASTGQFLKNVMLDGIPGAGGWSPSLDRLFCAPGSVTHLLASIDGTGDSIAGIVPLTLLAGSISLDTVHNRLYFAYASSGSGCIGVADCSRNIVTSYTYAGEDPAAVCYNPNNNRLYWRTGSSLTVYDCSTNTVVGKVKTSGGVRAVRLHFSLNKLYANAVDTLGHPVIDVIDCERDSVARVVALPGGLGFLFIVPEDNTLWCLGTSHVMAIDCLGDSIVADAIDNLGSIDDAVVCREDRKIYTSDGQVIDMDDPGHVDSIEFWGNRFCYVPSTHRLYGCTNEYNPYFLVLDTRSDTVTARFNSPCQVSGMCLSQNEEYVYCAGYEANWVLMIGVRADSVIAKLNVPTTAAARDPLVVNRKTNRIYEVPYNWSADRIPVIHDSMLIGLEESGSTSPPPRTDPTILRRGVPVSSEAAADMCDASGRVAAVLRPGLNDISRLAPGVYFAREQAAVANQHSGAAAARKLVIAR
jgi:DNA-binding beta-propeller fold protein YncE